jgi:hypothetical protein
MATTYLQGIPRVVDVVANVLDSDFAVSRQWNVNRNPLYARLPARPVDGYVLQTWPGTYRPRTTTLGAAVADGVVTTITLANAKIIMNGDRLLLNSGEIVEVVDHPNTTTNVVTVLRGVSGTTAAAQTNSTTVTNLGNSRTGAETFQRAITAIPDKTPQYVQTFQHVYSVGGGQAAVRTRYGGRAAPYDAEKQDKMVNITDDIEFAGLYGKAAVVSSTESRYAMNGLFNLITTNNVTAPTNASAYKPSDFLRDCIQPIINAGGTPGVAFVSPGWVTGLAVWGFGPLRLDAGSTVFGAAIEAFAVPSFGNVTFVYAPLMQGISAIVASEDELYWGVLEGLRSQEYGISGDAREGDWIARQAIMIENEARAAAVRNITGFAKEA